MIVHVGGYYSMSIFRQKNIPVYGIRILLESNRKKYTKKYIILTDFIHLTTRSCSIADRFTLILVYISLNPTNILH